LKRPDAVLINLRAFARYGAIRAYVQAVVQG
jgi:hypothetical protein